MYEILEFRINLKKKIEYIYYQMELQGKLEGVVVGQLEIFLLSEE